MTTLCQANEISRLTADLKEARREASSTPYTLHPCHDEASSTPHTLHPCHESHGTHCQHPVLRRVGVLVICRPV